MKENKLQTVGAVAGYILSGGRNTRMEGQKKLFLRYAGETFCQRILHACDCLPAVYLSVDNKEPYRKTGLPMVEDRWRGIGPLGGIASGLLTCKEDALFVMACDMPMMERQTVERMLEMYEKIFCETAAAKAERPAGPESANAAESADGANLQPPVLVASQNGRIHPLFGIYPKRVLPFAEELIREGDYRIMHFLERAGYRTLELEPESHAMENINSTEEYRRLAEAQNAGENPYTAAHPFVFAISGYKNSGKTTLITRLIPELTGRGYKGAVIKHDGHDFKSDVPGTDSYRHQKAGAYGTAVFSKNRFLITKECHGITERDLFSAFPEADIILIEGLKNSSYPKYFCAYPEKTLPDAAGLADEMEKIMQQTAPV